MGRPRATPRKRRVRAILEDGTPIHNSAEMQRIEPVHSLLPAPSSPSIHRNSIYTEELGERICSYLAQGMTLIEACEHDKSLPPHATIREWSYKNYYGFAVKYDLAFKLGCYAMAEQLFKVADDGSNDYIQKVSAAGTAFTVPNMEHIARSKLRIDTRKWFLSKLFPSQFGENINVAVTSTTESDLGILLAQVCTAQELDDLRNRLMAHKAKQVAASTSNNDTRDSAAHSRDDT